MFGFHGSVPMNVRSWYQINTVAVVNVSFMITLATLHALVFGSGRHPHVTKSESPIGHRATELHRCVQHEKVQPVEPSAPPMNAGLCAELATGL